MSISSGPGKICVKCSVDVAAKPRMKDSKGRYYCKPCFEQVQQRSVSNAPRPAQLRAEAPISLIDQLIDAAPQHVATMQCPQCKSTIEAAAVICIGCGLNLQSGVRAQPRVLPQPSARTTVKAWPIVIGVVSLVLGLLDTLLQTLNTIAMFSEGGNVRVRAGIVPIILALVLAHSGVQILMRRAAGAKRIVQWAWIKTVLGLTCFGIGFAAAISSQTAADAIAARFGLDGIGQAGLVIALAIEFLWYTGWAIFILAWFHRASVQTEVENWG